MCTTVSESMLITRGNGNRHSINQLKLGSSIALRHDKECLNMPKSQFPSFPFSDITSASSEILLLSLKYFSPSATHEEVYQATLQLQKRHKKQKFTWPQIETKCKANNISFKTKPYHTVSGADYCFWLESEKNKAR